MKKFIFGILFLSVFSFPVSAIASSGSHFNHGNSSVNIGISYNNGIMPQSQVVNNGCRRIMTPPPPPPRHNKFIYANDMRFGHRSYYVPSYCMPQVGFYYQSNPFCTQYRPYGSSIFLSF